MFLKKSKYKNGRTFLSIVEAYRDENGEPRQRLIQKIGYLPFKYTYNELNNYEIRKIYRVLSKIEDTFKVSKTNFGTRPIYVDKRTYQKTFLHMLYCTSYYETAWKKTWLQIYSWSNYYISQKIQLHKYRQEYISVYL